MAKTKKDTALAKAPQQVDLTKPVGFLNDGIGALAQALSDENLAPRTLGIVLKEARGYAETLKKLGDTARMLTIARLKKFGQPVPDTKSIMWVAEDGTKFTMHPTKSGTDPRKLEALLRAKGAKPALYMQETRTYEVDPVKLKEALDNETLTLDELKTCEYDESWTVRSPEVKS
jgi:hypothetical protein